MSQQSVFHSILKTIKENHPSRYERLVTSPPGTLATMAGDYASQNPTIFKARPPGQAGNPCYWTAEYFYAAALAVCAVITDPDIKAKCEADALDSYCESFDACAKA